MGGHRKEMDIEKDVERCEEWKGREQKEKRGGGGSDMKLRE